MPKCKVIKGFSWMDAHREVGEIIEQPAEWIANRVRDGLVEPIADEPEIETAVAPPAPERAVSPRGKRNPK